MAEWHLYLLRCDDRSLYTGIATDVARRISEHRGGSARGAKCLRGKGPLELVFERPIGGRGLAQRIEIKVKRLSKERKEQLILQADLIEGLLAELGAQGLK